MEEKNTHELNDEKLDEVTGGYSRPGDETVEQEPMYGQQKCPHCGKVVTPEWDQVKRKNICPKCRKDL